MLIEADKLAFPQFGMSRKRRVDVLRSRRSILRCVRNIIGIITHGDSREERGTCPTGGLISRWAIINSEL